MQNHNLSEIFGQILQSQEVGKQDFRWENVQEVAEALGVNQEDWQRVMEAFEQKIQTGHNFLKHDNPNDAQKAFEEANQLCPKHPKALLGLSLSYEMAYYQNKRLKSAQKAIKLAEEVIAQTAKNPRAFAIVSNLKKARAAQLSKRRKFWFSLGLALLILGGISWLSWQYSQQVWEKIQPKVKELTEFFRAKKGTSFTLNNVEFDLGSTTLDEAAQAELDRLVAFLKENPDIKGKISGHTDDLGDKISNKLVSQQRAEAVHQYLRKKGIPEGQITYEGYGGEQPKFPNNNAENRAKNRRIEFEIISSVKP